MGLRFAPWTRGVYDVSPGLRPLGTDFGNGADDGKLFPLDDEEERYAENKRRALRERRGKYVRYWRLEPEVGRAATVRIAEALAEEHPGRFAWDGSTLERDGVRIEGLADARDPSTSVNLLARMVQEDLVIVQVRAGADQTVAIHNCAPSRWSPEEVIGRSFVETHVPAVPGFGPVAKAGAGLMRACVEGPPRVRFVWGLEEDDRLDRHPEPADGWDWEEWDGRRFGADRPLTVRTERQTIIGLPEVGAFLFLIRVGQVREADLRPEWIPPLVAAIEAMTPEQLAYKGLTGDRREGALARLAVLASGG